MRSETLDYMIEGHGGDLWFVLSGPFTHEQIPTFREKFSALMEDGIRSFVVDLERITMIDNAVVNMFLLLLNTLRGKSGTIKFVFKNELVSRAFAPYKNIFSIYPDADLLNRQGLVALLRRQRRLLLRKTGVRISRSVAVFLLITVVGWFISLLFIIHLQNRHIKELQGELQGLSQWETKSRREIDRLRSRLQPLEQLGIVRDTAGVP